MKKKDGTKYDTGITAYLGLSDAEKEKFESIAEKECRSKSNLATLIVKQWLSSQIDDTEPPKTSKLKRHTNTTKDTVNSSK